MSASITITHTLPLLHLFPPQLLFILLTRRLIHFVFINFVMVITPLHVYNWDDYVTRIGTIR